MGVILTTYIHWDDPPREPQHTPGAYPRHPQTLKWKDILHKQMVEGLGYVPGVCWKILWSKVDICQGAGSSASLLDNSMASRLGKCYGRSRRKVEMAKDVYIPIICIYIYIYLYMHHIYTYNMYIVYIYDIYPMATLNNFTTFQQTKFKGVQEKRDDQFQI